MSEIGPCLPSPFTRRARKLSGGKLPTLPKRRQPIAAQRRLQAKCAFYDKCARYDHEYVGENHAGRNRRQTLLFDKSAASPLAARQLDMIALKAAPDHRGLAFIREGRRSLLARFCQFGSVASRPVSATARRVAYRGAVEPSRLAGFWLSFQLLSRGAIEFKGLL